MSSSQPTFLGRLLTALLRLGLSLRYRIEPSGLDAIRARGRRGVLFLPNHPALGDPVVTLTLLYRDFAPRSLADEYQIDRPVIRTFARWLGARPLPNLERRGIGAREGTRKALADTIDGLKAGENLLLYPAGHVKHQVLEEIGATSGVRTVLDAVPDLRVVLVRMNGAWGSSLSWAATGHAPDLVPVLRRGLVRLLLNGILFMPRRRLTVEFVEPDDFPRDADRMAINRYLEAFYNDGASPNTYVPYRFWEPGGVRALPEPEPVRMDGHAESAPQAVRQQVIDQLMRVSGREQISLADRIADDLGLDSLATAELIVWIQHEFGFAVGTPESLRTVGDVVLAAAGKGISALEIDLKRAGPRMVRARPLEARNRPGR